MRRRPPTERGTEMQEGHRGVPVLTQGLREIRVAGGR